MKDCNVVQKVRTLILITKCTRIRMEEASLKWRNYNESLSAMRRIETWHHRQRLLEFMVSIAIYIFYSRIGYHYGFYGFPGLFLAAICAHSLSIISTGFNAISQGLWVQLFVRVSSFIIKYFNQMIRGLIIFH